MLVLPSSSLGRQEDGEAPDQVRELIERPMKGRKGAPEVRWQVRQ